MTNTTAIELKHINKSYGDVPVLRDFNLEIQKGDLVTAIGSSGCGKTTVLKLMNGLLSPDSGQVLIEGQDIARIEQDDLRQHMGYVIQGIGLFPHMKIKDNLAYVLKLQKRDHPFIKQRIRELLDLVHLSEDLLHRYPHELSGGQRQRVGLGRALAAKPEIILMDEPLGAVDEITKHELQTEILNIHQATRTTIFFITHDIQEALTLGSKLMVMKDGTIHQYDEPEYIVKNPSTDFTAKLIGQAYGQ
ncbi:ABC transporter ATP-binding protein [Spirochaeta cellobiosiphila]|uniref:ATP-binding cassette domain-containing protein n=1 Tax=Spirochaeta cellobiosiphila TaxID=504483 RepID=UPI0003FC8D18|nr:ABC transporter ATP-binding protein [Spirochaeta cellobiosiphila]